MNITKQKIGLLAIILGVTAISAGSAFAYQGKVNEPGPNYTAERYEAMTKAFEEGDYSTWKNLVQNQGRVGQMITANNFATFVKAHDYAQKGDTAKAQELRNELGLGLHNGSGKDGEFKGMKNGTGRGYNR